MDKIEKLLAKLCPGGVAHISLGEITKECVARNTTRSILEVRSVTNSAGLVSTDDYFVNTRTSQDTSNYKVVNQGMFVYNPSRINVGSIAQHKEAITVIVSPMYVVVEIDESKLMPEYLELFLFSARGKFQILSRVGVGARFRLPYEEFSHIKLPLPPLEVQKEIVEILGIFATLKAELEAELDARNKQYEWYRERIISKASAHLEKLENIAEIYLGLTYTPMYVDSGVKFISAQNISSDFLDLSNVKYISKEEYKNSTSNAKPKRGDVLFTRVGSNLGHPVIVDTDEPLCIFVSLGYLRVNKEKALNSYIKHWVNTDLFWAQVRKNVHGSAKVNLNTGWLRNFEVVLPSLEDQRRIVSILDKFETLLNDLSVGLPAEIKARKEQYEYYGEKLLTFKPLEKEYANQ